ncbi:MAG TPA: aminopeptidase P N-terminal domain-containing protein, partial [Fibrobacteraceae bacterium]|nr:aminopeptidase P N-terminal domain-containing protein [Fibrobacteraceae bacterium]
MNAPLQHRFSQVFLSSQLGVSASKVYATRRKQLLSELSSLCLFAGVPMAPGAEHPWAYTFDRRVQEPAFLYLTGVNQPGAFLALDPFARNPRQREVLFLPERRLDREFWDGAMLGVSDPKDSNMAQMRSLTGFSEILPATEFWDWLRKRLPAMRRHRHLMAFWHEYPTMTGKTHSLTTDSTAQFRDRLQAFLRQESPQMELRCVAPLHLRQRLSLDPKRLAMARSAQRCTREAFFDLLSSLTTHDNERTVLVQLESFMRAQGDDGLAFPTIVAGGDNACTLHYIKCDEPLRQNRLLLLDFGMRCGSLCSDISRTLPLSGKFNPLQRLLYQIVLDTQKFHQSQVRAGKKLRELNANAWAYMEHLLSERFLNLGGVARRAYPGERGPHGI